MIKKNFILIFLFFISSFAFAGGDIDTNYVQKFRNIFAIKLFLINNNFTYTIIPRNNSNFTTQQLKDAQVIYNPNIPPTVGVSLNIKGIGLAYVFKITNDYLDTTGRAKSDFKQFQMNMYGNKFGMELYYQDYQRFYFHYKGDEVLLKNYNSDIRAYQWGANGIFIFNGKKFSYNAAFNQTVFQKKSAGSWMMTMALKFNELKSHNLIPDSVNAFYGIYNNLERNRNYSFIMQTGYAFDLTKSNFYFSGALFAGAGIQNQVYTLQGDKFYKIAFPLVGRIKSSIGYNGKLFFTGIYANVDASQSSIKSIKTQQMVSSYGVFLGFRVIQYTKSKGQLKAEAKAKKDAEKAAIKKAKEEKKKAAAEKKKKK